MANRKRTPDILGDLLGGSDPTAAEQEPKMKGTEGEQVSLPIEGFEKPKKSKKRVKAKDSDIEYFESLLDRGASALELVAEVLGRPRLVKWLDEMKVVFSGEDVVMEEEQEEKREQSTGFKQKVATWTENHFGATSATVDYSANGLTTKMPYEVDIWAHFNGENSRTDLEMWVECRESRNSVKSRDILNLVRKATDVFNAAHTVKQEFWFDRLMIVSSAPFEDSALEIAVQRGVICVLCDGAGYELQTEENWRLKPSWLRDAELERVHC